MPSNFKTNYDFLFVGKDEGSFVENYAYDLGEGGENSGKIFICMEITQNSQDPDKIGEIVFDKMRKVFFADGEISGYERFEESLKEVNRALNEYKIERGNDWLGKLNVVIAAIVGPELYLTQTGEAEAYLVRKRFATTISDDLSDQESKDIFTNIASGDLEAGDLILFSTTRLLRYVSKNDLAKHVVGSLSSTVMSIKDFLMGEVVNKIGLIAIQANSVTVSAQDTTEIPLKVEHTVEESYRDPAVAQKAVRGSFSMNNVKTVFGGVVSKARRRIEDLSRGGMDRESRGSSWNFSNWGKDKILLAVIGLIVVLTMGVWWLRAKGDEDKRVADLANELILIREEINSAITTGQYDKDRAGEMLSDAETRVIAVLESGFHKAKARELGDLILETRDKLDGVLHPKMEKMANLAEKRANVSALGLVNLKDKLYAYEYNALYPVMLDKVADPLTIDDNEKVVSAVNYDDKDSILFFTESGKVIEYKDDRMNFLNTTDSKFKLGKVIKAYSNKIYLLDAAGSQIWKYTRRRDTFDGAEAYAVGGVDLKGAVDLAIDGSVYVLGDNGYITKLFQGAKQDFPIKKQPVKVLSSPTKIYTEADMNQIYVMEPSTDRILVFNKDERVGGAVYSSQYIFDEIQDMRDFYVDKDTNMLYLLTKDAVYRTAL